MHLGITTLWYWASACKLPDSIPSCNRAARKGFGLNTTNDSRVIIFGGGIHLKLDGIVVGAVGANGGSVEQDVAVARAAVAGFLG